MPYGVVTFAASAAEAEQQIRSEATGIHVLRSRELDLSGLPPLRSGPHPRQWVVVVRNDDREVEGRLSRDDPEGHCEREARKMWLAMALDPELLSTGVIEEFDCPSCSARVHLELPSPRETSYPLNRQCSSCSCHLRRTSGELEWQAVPHPPKPPPSCAFCGDPADSREHVIPAWIAKRLGMNEMLSADDAVVIGVERRKQPISFASYRARVMCGSCNWHFKHLEDAVIPLLEPIAHGTPMTINLASQRQLALWAGKTAIALMADRSDSGSGRRLLPLGRQVRDDQLPRQCWVACYAWRGGPVISTSYVGSAGRRGEDEFLAVILSFSGVALHVICPLEELPEGLELHGTHPAGRQLWPACRPLVTLPPPPIDNRLLPTLMGFLPLRAKVA